MSLTVLVQLLEWHCLICLMRFQAADEQKNRLQVAHDKYKAKELLLARVYLAYAILTTIIYVLPLLIIWVLLRVSYLTETRAYFIIRLIECSVYLGNIIHACTISLMLVLTMRAKMYLYYDDHKRSLLIQIASLITLLIFLLMHTLLELGEHSLDIQSNPERYFIYFVLTLLGVLMFTLSKAQEDFFVQLNRDRTFVRVSMFQRDYFGQMDQSSRS